MIIFKREPQSSKDSKAAAVPVKLNSGCYACPVCNKYLSDRFKCALHIKTHFCKTTCSVCGREFGRPGDLKLHMALHEGRTTCPKCKKVFSRADRLKIHMNKYQTPARELLEHPDLDNIISVQSQQLEQLQEELLELEEDDTTGKVCGRTVSSQHNLQVHMTTHSANRGRMAFKCSKCGSVLTSEENLRRHMRYCKKGPKQQLGSKLKTKGFAVLDSSPANGVASVNSLKVRKVYCNKDTPRLTLTMNEYQEQCNLYRQKENADQFLKFPRNSKEPGLQILNNSPRGLMIETAILELDKVTSKERGPNQPARKISLRLRDLALSMVHEWTALFTSVNGDKKPRGDNRIAHAPFPEEVLEEVCEYLGLGPLRWVDRSLKQPLQKFLSNKKLDIYLTDYSRPESSDDLQFQDDNESVQN
ncbi:Hypothetical predicted protein [Cloeon dipterum]|uniref:C2H2-type domain-containing protein n=1 Tax=Cloeon dipterum TaxID=197152 RepID=A0A8S1CFS0_9INSE|nr:Hypothetical predicted protein [Cloeon dipterum]